MSEVVKIKVAKVGRKEMPSKFKEGETYNITTILDEISGRKGAAMGAFADSWKVGDTVEGIWEERKYTDKDGFEQKSWNIKNPVASKGGKGAMGQWGPRKPTLVDAYQIAAALAPVVYREKKSIKFDDIVKLADEVMKKLGAAVPAEAKKAEGKDVDLNKEEKKSDKKEEADDFDVKDAPAPKKAETEEAEEDGDDIF